MSEEEIKAIIDKVHQSRDDVVRVTQHEFWRFAQALNAKFEHDEVCYFITLQTPRGMIRLEPQHGH